MNLMSYKTFNNKQGKCLDPPEMFLKLAFTLSVIDQLLPLRPLDWSSLTR